MIVCGLLTVLVGLLDALFALLPEWDWTLDEVAPTGTDITAWDQGSLGGESSGLTSAFLMMARANRFVPVDHMFYVLQFLGTVVAAVLLYRGVKFVINVIRGAGA